MSTNNYIRVRYKLSGRDPWSEKLIFFDDSDHVAVLQACADARGVLCSYGEESVQMSMWNECEQPAAWAFPVINQQWETTPATQQPSWKP